MIRDDLTAGTCSANPLLLRPDVHGFVAEGDHEPGMRPFCRVCGGQRGDAAHAVPAPRGAAE